MNHIAGPRGTAVAAVELATLMLDSEEDPGPIEAAAWQPKPLPGSASLLIRGLADRAREPLELVRWQARWRPPRVAWPAWCTMRSGQRSR